MKFLASLLEATYHRQDPTIDWVHDTISTLGKTGKSYILKPIDSFNYQETIDSLKSKFGEPGYSADYDGEGYQWIVRQVWKSKNLIVEPAEEAFMGSFTISVGHSTEGEDERYISIERN
jgi:hypothetical protein